LLVADVAAALRAREGWDHVVRLAYRDAALRDAAIHWAGAELLFERDRPTTAWDTLMAAAERFSGLTFVATEASWDPAGRFRRCPFLRVDVPSPTLARRRDLWLAYAPGDRDLASTPAERAALCERLASAIRLEPGQIRDAVANARAAAVVRDPTGSRVEPAELFEGARRQSGRRIVEFARRIEPRRALGFEDLVLPPSSKRQLEELRARVRNRHRLYEQLGFDRRLPMGAGLVTLFTGTSGTGKTMAAELLAREHGVDLYKVDLSAIVSKYVGETEKNLNRVFADAEHSNAVIFFDECDALFGKRGDVKEAQDRWANMEVNFLLQRIEEYAGVVILATNLRQNRVEAFVRRSHVIVEFPFPDVAGRAAIWRGMFPDGVGRPSDDECDDRAECERDHSVTIHRPPRGSCGITLPISTYS
jgi:hypothetical protein